MRYTSPLDELLGQRSKVRTLRYLAGGAEVSGRQVAAAVGMSPTVVHRALNELVQEGAALTRRVGTVHLFKLDPESYLVQKLVGPLFEEERRVPEVLAREVARVAGRDVVSVVLFGSVAARTEKARSDVDLLVIVRDAARKARLERAVEDEALGFMRRFGNLLSPYVVTQREFVRRYRKEDPLLREAVRTGRVIVGRPMWEVLAGDTPNAQDPTGRQSGVSRIPQEGR